MDEEEEGMEVVGMAVVVVTGEVVMEVAGTEVEDMVVVVMEVTEVAVVGEGTGEVVMAAMVVVEDMEVAVVGEGMVGVVMEVTEEAVVEDMVAVDIKSLQF